MRLHVGTSGYSYKEWKGSFYPADLPAKSMLRFYAGVFGTVEINNTFYRMPVAGTMEKWAADVPPEFRFSLKAPQRITHQKRLADCADDVRHFHEVAAALGPALGPLLYQLPPYAKKDAAKLRDFLASLPGGARVAFEFRHASWEDEEVRSLLAEHGVALCAAETEETADADALLHPTARFGYLRLRRLDYSDDALAAWHRRIAAQPWEEAYVFFKHEDEAKGPAFAKRFLAMAPPE